MGDTWLTQTSPTISTSIIAGTSTFNLLNATATTINFGGAAQALNIGASSCVTGLGGRLLVGGAVDIDSSYSAILKAWIALNNDRIASGFARNWGIHTNNTVEGSLEFYVGATEGANPSIVSAAIDSVGSFKAIGGVASSSPSVGLGYATGAGGAVTQTTSKDTNVTINKVCGTITMNNAALAAGAKISFYVFNSVVAWNDTVEVIARDGFFGNYIARAYQLSPGAFAIQVENTSGSSQSEAATINFSVIKGVSS